MGAVPDERERAVDALVGELRGLISGLESPAGGAEDSLRSAQRRQARLFDACREAFMGSGPQPAGLRARLEEAQRLNAVATALVDRRRREAGDALDRLGSARRRLHPSTPAGDGVSCDVEA